MSAVTPAAPHEQRFADLDALARALATQIADTLATAVALRGLASLAVSGGKSPLRLFTELRTHSLDWSRVCIALVDERWVAATEDGSNERFVRDALLRDKGAAARFSGLKNGAATPEDGETAAWQTFAAVPRPFDSVVLGMGDDGHTASLFPKSPRLAEALDPNAAPACIAMRSPTAPQARISLNLAALLDSRRILLLLTGEAKWLTYIEARRDGPVEDMPIRAVLRQQRTPVDVFWSP